MKRCEFFIIINTESGKKPVKVRGYMFQKCGHWFTVRHSMPSEKLHHKKWIISDFVTGLIMMDTDNKIEDIPSVISESTVARMLELYRNNKVSIYTHRSNREELQQYAEMIHDAMYKNNPNSNMLDLLKDQSYELYN